MDYHNYRDMDIKNFIPVVTELIQRGYFGIRMGKEVQGPLHIDESKYVDIVSGITGMPNTKITPTVKDFDQWIQLDLQYIDNWSFGMDFKIIIKTVGTVLSGSGV